MAKKNEQINEVVIESTSTVIRPVVDAITEWLLPLVPAALRPNVEAARQAIIGEQDGFNRSGNRTDYRRDKLAFASAGVEKTPEGVVFVRSNMKGRRVADIVRIYIVDHVGRYLYPESLDKKGNVQTHKTAREKFALSLGFEEEQVGGGKRLQLGFEKPGTQELFAKIEALVPERFEGTEQAVSTKAQVKFITSSELGSEAVYSSLYDPDQPSVNEEAFRKDLKKVTIWLDAGWQLGTDRKGQLTRVASHYATAYKAAKAAPQQQPMVA